MWKQRGERGIPSLVQMLMGSIMMPGNPFAYLERKRLPCGKCNVHLVPCNVYASSWWKCPFGGILLIGMNQKQF